MFHTHVARFASEPEAEAFALGVDFVNDSSVEVTEILADPDGSFVVHLNDADYRGDGEIIEISTDTSSGAR